MNNPEKKKERDPGQGPEPRPSIVSDGSTASYYELPEWALELADLIRYKNLNGSQAEMFRAIYRGAEASHSDEQRQAKKILAYAVDEMVRTHFPEESFAPYRSATFRIFEQEERVKPLTEPLPKPLTEPLPKPDRSCTTCAYYKLDLQGGVEYCTIHYTRSQYVNQAWAECNGKFWVDKPVIRMKSE